MTEVYEGADSEESEDGLGYYLHSGHEIAFRKMSRDVFIVFVNSVMSRVIGKSRFSMLKKGFLLKEEKRLISCCESDILPQLKLLCRTE